MSGRTVDPETHRLIAKVLTLHFQEGTLQAEIAKNMNLSTAKVNRLIKQGRELGMIEFTIRSPYQRLFDLETKLKAKWDLKDCLVVDAVTGNNDTTLEQVGRAAAAYVNDTVTDNSIVGISGGKAVSAVAENISATKSASCKVVPLTGGVQGQHFTDVNHIATLFASQLGASANLIHAPLHANSMAERDLLLSVHSVAEHMKLARQADIAVLGVGSVKDESSTYYQAYPLSNEGKLSLYEDGVRAEFLGHLLDGNGALCDNEHNSRLVSLPLSEATKIPTKIGVASGQDKVEPVRAALCGGFIDVLVVDDHTASEILSV